MGGTRRAPPSHAWLPVIDEIVEQESSYPSPVQHETGAQRKTIEEYFFSPHLCFDMNHVNQNEATKVMETRQYACIEAGRSGYLAVHIV
jgi:hypothetical protein